MRERKIGNAYVRAGVHALKHWNERTTTVSKVRQPISLPRAFSFAISGNSKWCICVTPKFLCYVYNPRVQYPVLDPVVIGVPTHNMVAAKAVCILRNVSLTNHY